MIAPTELMSKLKLRSGHRLWLINAPARLAEELAAGAEVEIVHEKDEHDGVIAYVDSAAEAELLVPRILAEMPPDGLLWVGGDAADWKALKEAGWSDRGQIDIGEGRVLTRFRPD